jgi:S-DNA-T family DNA segregation ATPase FtsK/SpoIIIE
MPTRLDAAAQQLKQAHAYALGALGAASVRVANDRAVAGKEAGTSFDRRVAIARNRAAQQVHQHSGTARDIAVELVAHAASELQVADYVVGGTLTLRGAETGVNDRVTAPCLLPFVGRGNIFVDLPDRLGPGFVRHLVREAFAGTAPGQLDVIGYDPRLTGLLSPFASLKSAAESSMTVVSRPHELTQVADRLVGDVQRVNDLMRGTSETLLDFRSSAGHPVERLQLCVLLDAPEGMDEATFRQFTSLTRIGPAAGISFLWVTTKQRRGCEWWTPAELGRWSSCIRGDDAAVTWSAHPQFTLDVPLPDAARIAEQIDALASVIASASVPSVPFARVQQTAHQWTDSSADGLTFAVGVSGSRPVEITLGDERQQRHNALITGAVGQGKSNLIKVVVHSLCQRYAPSELELHMLDFKAGVTLFPFASTPGSPDYLPHARVLGLESDRDFGLAVLRHLEAELDRRSRLFRPYGDDISKYRAAVPDAHMPRIVLVIDEFQMMFDPVDANAEAAALLLEGLARRGRSCGVHVILASQTISGIAALMTRENGIFAQFPVRLALKNTVGESYASLAQGNDAASRLRMRGEAIVNLDYGSVLANQHAVIAVGDDAALAAMQHAWWEVAKTSSSPPVVFDGARRVRVSDAMGAMRALRRRVVNDTAQPAALLGFPIDVTGAPLAVSLPADPGRNIAVLGAGEKSAGLDDAGDASNIAVGILQAASVSLAVQHPEGDADFVCLDFLDPVLARRNNLSAWLSLMERLGFPVTVIGRSEAGAYLRELASVLSDGGPEQRTYVIGLGMDRAPNLEVPDAFARRPVEDLQAILRDGPVMGVHVIGSWTNAATFKSHLGFGGDGFVETMVMLRMDQGAVQELLGPFVSWSVRDNRGLASDRTQLAEPMTIVPFSPLEAQDVQAVLRADWVV